MDFFDEANFPSNSLVANDCNDNDNDNDNDEDQKVRVKKDIQNLLERLHPDVSPDQLEKILEVILEEVSIGLSLGDRLEIRGFGSMSIRKRESGVVRNPRSGASVTVGDRAALYFRPSRDFIQALNKEHD